MPRFFVDLNQIQGDFAQVTGEDAHHIRSVLRSRIGEDVILCDGCGMDYSGTIKEIGEKEILIQISRKEVSSSEPKTKVTLFQGLPKGDKMEWIIQKCVESGIDQIIPVSSAHCIVKLGQKEEKKRERWQKIAESAAKQSGRGKIPQIGKVVSFFQAVEQAKSMNGALIPYEKEENREIRQFVSQFQGQTIALFIGPEGGFAEEEIELAEKAGILPVTLGKRILRTETAGLAALTILLYELE